MGDKLEEPGKEQRETKIMKIREAPQQYVMQTPYASCFTIGNTITRSSGEDGKDRMVLLDVVVGEGVFSFRAHVRTIKKFMWMGVTDRVTQKEKNYPEPGDSIYYHCFGGSIYYATADGKC